MAKLTWHGKKAVSLAEAAIIQALGTCASDLQGKSAAQAPIETGDLRANCSVSPVKRGKTNISLSVGYDLVYAIVQHERLDFNHPRGGKAKFLEDPFKENREKYARIISNAVNRALGKG